MEEKKKIRPTIDYSKIYPSKAHLVAPVNDKLLELLDEEDDEDDENDEDDELDYYLDMDEE